MSTPFSDRPSWSRWRAVAAAARRAARSSGSARAGAGAPPPVAPTDDARRYRAHVEAPGDAVTVVERDGTIRCATPSIETILGSPADTLSGTRLIELVHPEDREWVTAQYRHALERPGAVEGPLLVRWRHRDGGYRWLENTHVNLLGDPAVRATVINSRDVSDRVGLEDQLARRAFHDTLTGLANRSLLLDRLEHALFTAGAPDERLAVVVIDLDGFGDLCDSLGHEGADGVLQACARRLTERLGAGDTAARIGADEFAVVLEACGTPDAAVQMARYLLDALAEPIELHGRRLGITACAGIALASRREQPPGREVLRNADIALRRAKAEAPGRYRLFEERMHTALLRRMELEAELRRAVAAGQFVLHYQPIVDAEGGTPAGAEALVRWAHPERGLVLPCDFVPVAEQAGILELLGTWILREAVRQAAAWRRAGLGGGRLWVSVNLSVAQLANPAFVGEVELALREHGLPADLLVLELTESAVMRDVVTATHRLDALKALGVRIAVDDFGEGHSSLAYLSSLPLDLLKIPKTFVDALARQDANPGLVRAIVELARSFGLRTVAEGVETAEQLQALRHLGCDLAQGYLFARPAEPAAIAALAGPGARPTRLAGPARAAAPRG